MTDQELHEICDKLNVRVWPAHVPLLTRLEITKARLTLTWRFVERLKASGTLTGMGGFAEGMYRGDSNGAAAMLRCVDEYSHGFDGGKVGPDFDEPWALAILRKHEAIIKEITQ